MKVSLKPCMNKNNKQINFSLRNKKHLPKHYIDKILSKKEIIVNLFD